MVTSPNWFDRYRPESPKHFKYFIWVNVRYATICLINKKIIDQIKINTSNNFFEKTKWIISNLEKATLCPGDNMISFLKNLQHWHKKCDNFPLTPTQCPNYNGPGYKPPCSHTVFSGFCQSEDSCTAEGGKKGLTVSISKIINQLFWRDDQKRSHSGHLF